MVNFLEWASVHGKQYEDQAEFSKRFEAFVKNQEALEGHWAQHLGAGAGEMEPHVLELNKFADWTDEEYSALLGFKPDLSKPVRNQWIFERDVIPDSINWVQKGVVTEVKDQGTCGSCWSFSTTGAIESAYHIKNGKSILLSEQQLVDCSVSYGNNGCSGGLVEYAFNYAKHVPLETESEYPYKAANQKCAAAAHPDDVQLSTFYEVARFSPMDLAMALQKGPVSVGVDASGIAFKFYKKGIIKKWCGTDIDHAVLLVGYGTDSGVDYWLVKNSWGKDWGESGYFRVLRDMDKKDEGMCGIQQTPSYPVV